MTKKELILEITEKFATAMINEEKSFKMGLPNNSSYQRGLAVAYNECKELLKHLD